MFSLKFDIMCGGISCFSKLPDRAKERRRKKQNLRKRASLFSIQSYLSFLFNFYSEISLNFRLEDNGRRYVFVADFEALSCQVTRKFIRCRNAETRTISAIKYTACCAYGFYFFHFFLQIKTKLLILHSII